jgi:Leucine-rich repeat (LRR) protein
VPVSDISCFANLIHMTKLDMSSTHSTDPDGLFSLTGLTQLTTLLLSCSTEEITDFSPLIGMTLLTELCLFGCECNDISFMSTMPLLKKVDISWCTRVESIAECDNMEFLEWLDISGIPVTDIRPLSRLTRLPHLVIQYCSEIDDISTLQSNTLLHYDQ